MPCSCTCLARYLGPEQKLLLLPCVACDHYLDQLSKVECNLWDKSLHTRYPSVANFSNCLLLSFRNSRLPLSLAWHKFRGTYWLYCVSYILDALNSQSYVSFIIFWCTDQDTVSGIGWNVGAKHSFFGFLSFWDSFVLNGLYKSQYLGSQKT